MSVFLCRRDGRLNPLIVLFLMVFVTFTMSQSEEVHYEVSLCLCLFFFSFSLSLTLSHCLSVCLALSLLPSLSPFSQISAKIPFSYSTNLSNIFTSFYMLYIHCLFLLRISCSQTVTSVLTVAKGPPFGT